MYVLYFLQDNVAANAIAGVVYVDAACVVHCNVAESDDDAVLVVHVCSAVVADVMAAEDACVVAFVADADAAANVDHTDTHIVPARDN